MNYLGRVPSFDRVVQIALLGGYSINPIIDIDLKNNEVENFNLLIDFFEKKTNVKFSNSGEINYEFSKLNDALHTQETVESFLEKIESRRNHLVKNTKLDQSSITIIATAKKHLNLSEFEINKIKSIATTIAQLDGDNKVDVMYVAEAIQYSYINPENSMSLYDSVVNIGENISIKLNNLNKIDIEKAIEFLKTKI